MSFTNLLIGHLSRAQMYISFHLHVPKYMQNINDLTVFQAELVSSFVLTAHILINAPRLAQKLIRGRDEQNWSGRYHA